MDQLNMSTCSILRHCDFIHRGGRMPSGPPVPELFNLNTTPPEQYNVWDRNRDRDVNLLAKMHVESKYGYFPGLTPWEIGSYNGEEN